MPKRVDDIKEFLLISRRKDVKRITIKKGPTKKVGKVEKIDSTKFKVRCSKYLYTLTVDSNERAEKLRKSLPPGVELKEIK